MTFDGVSNCGVRSMHKQWCQVALAFLFASLFSCRLPFQLCFTFIVSNKNGYRHHSPSITARLTSGWRTCCQHVACLSSLIIILPVSYPLPDLCFISSSKNFKIWCQCTAINYFVVTFRIITFPKKNIFSHCVILNPSLLRNIRC